MGRPRKEPSQRRDSVLSIRLTAEAKAKFDAAAATAGTSRSEYLQAILDGTTAGAALPEQQTA